MGGRGAVDFQANPALLQAAILDVQQCVVADEVVLGEIDPAVQPHLEGTLFPIDVGAGGKAFSMRRLCIAPMP